MILPQSEFERLGLQAPLQRTPIPHGPQSFTPILDQWVAHRPAAEALVGRHARYSYAELDAEINAAATALLRAGVQPGDRLAASTGNHPDIVIAFLAAQRIGAIWVGINKALTAPEKIWMLRFSGVSLLLADHQTLEQIRTLPEQLPDPFRMIEMNGGPLPDAWREFVNAQRGAGRVEVDLDPWAPAMISFTSGTTGLPKGVVHSQHNAVLLGAGAVHRGQWDIGLRRGSAQPLTITNIMIRFATASLYAGATFVCMDRMDVEGTVEWVAREKIQTFSAVPTMIYDLLFGATYNPQDLATLIRPIVGATGMSEKVMTKFRERFHTDLQFSYGLTEAPTGVAQTDPEQPFIVGSSGRALPHLQVVILDDEGKLLPAGAEGEICIGPQTTDYWANVYTPALGYWNDARATEALLRGGWLHTGDIGALDETGNLFVKDRRSDLILRGGANVYPAEIEHAIMQDQRVRACAVLGIPDERLGERVVAVIDFEGRPQSAEAILAELHTHCMSSHARYKVPDEWFVVDAMPRNSMNKVIKPQLKRRVIDGDLQSTWRAPRRA